MLILFSDNYNGNSGESFCSSDISLDGTEVGYEMADSENANTESNQGTSSHSHHPGTTQEPTSLSQGLNAAMHNPIDKLFMMQNSYFSGDHA